MSDQTFVIETEYGINYTTRDPVPIPEIIDSLKNVERLIHRTPAFIERVYHGIQVVEIEVFVKTLQTGSLVENFIVKFVFKGEDNYEKAKEVFSKMLEDNTMLRTVVAMGVGALITYGVVNALPSNAPKQHIEAYNNNIITIGGEVGLESKDIQAVLKAVTDKKQLAKEAVSAVHPAKSDPDSTIEIAGIDALTIEPDYLREAPEKYEPPVPTEREDHYTNADIVIYASDRDKNEKGWAGIVPGIVDKRVQFSISEEIEPSKLHGHTRAKADIVVLSRYNKSKKAHEPKRVDIMSYSLR